MYASLTRSHRIIDHCIYFGRLYALWIRIWSNETSYLKIPFVFILAKQYIYQNKCQTLKNAPTL